MAPQDNSQSPAPPWSRNRKGVASGGAGDDPDIAKRLEAFRERFPVDDRAFDFLAKASDEVVEGVLNDFQPKTEGESDYSALLTKFVRSRADRSGNPRKGGGKGKKGKDRGRDRRTSARGEHRGDRRGRGGGHGSGDEDQTVPLALEDRGRDRRPPARGEHRGDRRGRGGGHRSGDEDHTVPLALEDAKDRGKNNDGKRDAEAYSDYSDYSDYGDDDVSSYGSQGDRNRSRSRDGSRAGNVELKASRREDSRSSGRGSDEEGQRGDSPIKRDDKVEQIIAEAEAEQMRKVAKVEEDLVQTREDKIARGVDLAHRDMQDALNEYERKLLTEKEAKIEKIQEDARDEFVERLREAKEVAKAVCQGKIDAARDADRAQKEKDDILKKAEKVRDDLRDDRKPATKRKRDAPPPEKDSSRGRKREGERAKLDDASGDDDSYDESQDEPARRKGQSGRNRDATGRHAERRPRRRAGRGRERRRSRHSRGRGSLGRNSRSPRRRPSRMLKSRSRRGRSGRGKRGRRNPCRREARSRRDDGSRGSGNNLEKLKEFKKRFPMDDRAWELLSRAQSDVQHAVLISFKPKREGEDDYSALVSSFVRSIVANRSQRERATRNSGRGNRGDGGGKGNSGKGDRGDGGGKGNRGSKHFTDVRQQRAAEREENGDGGGRRDDSQDRGPGREDSPLSAFRSRYPMDDRAFLVLEKASSVVRDKVLAEFKPKREGEDDYSALVQSVCKTIERRVGSA